MPLHKPSISRHKPILTPVSPEDFWLMFFSEEHVGDLFLFQDRGLPFDFTDPRVTKLVVHQDSKRPPRTVQLDLEKEDTFKILNMRILEIRPERLIYPAKISEDDQVIFYDEIQATTTQEGMNLVDKIQSLAF